MIFQSHNQFSKYVIGDLRTCTAGVVAVVTAIVLPVLLGFTSLGVEVGHWYLVQRQMQGADAAAISAAADYIAQYNSGTVNSTTYKTVGQSYALLNGFTIPTSNVCLALNNADCNTTEHVRHKFGEALHCCRYCANPNTNVFASCRAHHQG
jgi:uncharacterized membrane protein